MKYAHYDETNGKLLGWYDSEIHSTIPTPNISVTDADWQIAIDNNYNYIDAVTNTLSFKDFRTFTQLQEAKIAEIKAAFSTAVSSGFTCTNTITMDADISDILALKAGYDLAIALGQTTMDITDYNNADHTSLAVADVFTMITELGVNYNTLRTKKNALRTQALAATTQAELEVVQWVS